MFQRKSAKLFSYGIHEEHNSKYFRFSICNVNYIFKLFMRAILVSLL